MDAIIVSEEFTGHNPTMYRNNCENCGMEGYVCEGCMIDYDYEGIDYAMLCDKCGEEKGCW